MKSRVLGLLMATFLFSGSWLQAGEPVFYPYCAPLPKWLDLSRCGPCGCPDDYDKKCLPYTCPSPCGTCDDYCQKCLPKAPCPSPCGTCDDYCAKCGPIRLTPCLPAWFKCPPPNCAKCQSCDTGKTAAKTSLKK